MLYMISDVPDEDNRGTKTCRHGSSAVPLLLRWDLEEEWDRNVYNCLGSK